MASDYRVFLTDSFDWQYLSTNKATVCGILRDLGFEVVAEVPLLIVADCRYDPRNSRRFLDTLRAGSLLCDSWYVQLLPDGEIFASKA